MKFEEILPSLKEGREIRRKAWRKNDFIQVINDVIYNQNKDSNSLGARDLLADDWELYIDWAFVIDNYIICWFWNENKKRKRLGFLVNINNKGLYEYKCNPDSDSVDFYTNCEPVREGEYELY